MKQFKECRSVIVKTHHLNISSMIKSPADYRLQNNKLQNRIYPLKSFGNQLKSQVRGPKVVTETATLLGHKKLNSSRLNKNIFFGPQVGISFSKMENKVLADSKDLGLKFIFSSPFDSHSFCWINKYSILFARLSRIKIYWDTGTHVCWVLV